MNHPSVEEQRRVLAEWRAIREGAEVQGTETRGVYVVMPPNEPHSFYRVELEVGGWCSCGAYAREGVCWHHMAAQLELDGCRFHLIVTE